MMIRMQHTTAYHYSELVSLCHNYLHLLARPCPRQICHSESLSIDPQPGPIASHFDYFGNPVTIFTIQKPHRRLTITSKHHLEVKPLAPILLEETPPWERVVEELRSERSTAILEAIQFTYDSHYIRRGEDLADYARPSFPPGRPVLQGVFDLTKRIFREFRYDQKATTLATPIREVLRERRGVCQDFAHLQIGCLRSLGLAARYISGYLLTQPLPGQPRLIGADASHAWPAVYCPFLGWVEFDPTNNVMPSENHLTLAWGRDYDDVSPIKGVILGGGSHTMSVSVDVTPSS